jgi:hypothetical protein
MIDDEQKNSEEKEIKGFTIRMPEETRKKIRLISVYLDVSMQEIILNVINKEITKYEEDIPELRTFLNK